MTRATGMCLAVLVMFGVAVTPALAVAPGIGAVGQVDRHPAVALAAPRASTVTVSIASKPDRATDGTFLQENVVDGAFLTDSEIQSGKWLDNTQLEPGLYYVLLRASAESDCVTYDSEAVGSMTDPSCADGFSAVVPLRIPTPLTKYTVKTELLSSIDILYLTLTGTPLGVKLPYEVCWRQPSGKHELRKRCVNASLDGYSYSNPATDLLRLSTRGMSRRTKFTWYQRSGTPKALISKTITVR